MVILENQSLKPINFKEYQAKVKNKLKNPDILEFRLIIIS